MRSCFSLAIPSSLRFFQKRPSCGSPCSRGNRSLATAVSASYPPSRSYSDFFLMTCLLELSGERSFLFDALGLIQLQGALRRVEDDERIFPGIGHDCAEAYLNLEWSREHLAAGRREPRESLGRNRQRGPSPSSCHRSGEPAPRWSPVTSTLPPW